MTPRQRQHLLAIGALACVGLLLADRIIIGPAAARLSRHRERVQELHAEVLESSALIEQADSWHARLGEFREHAFPEYRSGAENEVIKTLRKWYMDAGLEVTALRTRWRPDEERYPCLEVHLNAAGNLEAVARFLYVAETARLPVRVTAVSLTSAAANPRSLSLGVDLEAVCWPLENGVAPPPTRGS